MMEKSIYDGTEDKINKEILKDIVEYNFQIAHIEPTIGIALSHVKYTRNELNNVYKTRRVVERALRLSMHDLMVNHQKTN